MSTLRDFIVSRVRVKILRAFLTTPQELLYIRQLTRSLGEEINAVRRELIHMEKVGMLKSQIRGNRVYYWFNTEYKYYPELLALIAKSTGLGRELIKNREKLGKVSFIVLSGRYARRMQVKKGQVDLLVVGEVILPQLAAIVKTAETDVGREINYSVMSTDELTFRKRRRDPFLMDLLQQSRIMLVGDEEALVP